MRHPIIAFVEPASVEITVNEVICQDETIDFSGLSHGTNGQPLTVNGIAISASANTGGINTIAIFDTTTSHGTDPDLEINMGNAAIIPDALGTGPLFAGLSDSGSGGTQTYD